MKEWSDSVGTAKTLAELNRVRRKHLSDYHEHSRRSTILYASGWLQKLESAPTMLLDGDIRLFREVSRDLDSEELDLILHSEGGHFAAARAIIAQLRSQFTHIRVVVPQHALSVAAWMCCGADEIVMDDCASLGPTDAQIPILTAYGSDWVPANAVLEATVRGKNVESQQLHVGKREDIQNEMRLLQRVAAEWMDTNMFREEAAGSSGKFARWRRSVADRLMHRRSPGRKIAALLSDYREFMTHDRHLHRDELKRMGLLVQDLESDEKLRKACRAVYFATTSTFTETDAAKIVENHRGQSFVVKASGSMDVEDV